MTHTLLGGRLVADHDQVEVSAVDGIAEVFDTHALIRRHPPEQVEMALGRVRLEVGVIDAVLLGRVRDRQHAVVDTKWARGTSARLS